MSDIRTALDELSRKELGEARRGNIAYLYEWARRHAPKGLAAEALVFTTRLVQTLIAREFLPAPLPGYRVFHRDGDLLDNEVTNLEYRPDPKTSENTVREMRRARQNGYSIAKTAARADVSESTVKRYTYES